jgi:hypothetical protein
MPLSLAYSTQTGTHALETFGTVLFRVHRRLQLKGIAAKDDHNKYKIQTMLSNRIYLITSLFYCSHNLRYASNIKRCTVNINQDTDKALELIAQINDEFLELASLLRQLQEKEPDDFKALLSIPELGRRKGYYLVEIDRAFADFDVLPQRLNKIGWTKLQIIARHVTAENLELLLTLAETHIAKNLELIMHGELPNIARTVLLLFTQEQFAVFSDAVLAHGAVASGAGFLGKEAALISALDKNKQ